MFIFNDAAKNDAAVQLAMQSYMQRLQKQEQQRQQIRDGLITPSPFTIVDISDRH